MQAGVPSIREKSVAGAIAHGLHFHVSAPPRSQLQGPRGIWDRRAVTVAPRPALLDTALAAAQLVVVVFILGSCVVFGLTHVALFLDDNAYHVPSAVRIAQHYNPYFVGDSPVDSHWFPAGAETLVAVLVALTGSLNTTNLSGALCAIALVVLMYRFAGVWGADGCGGLATAACASTIPLLIGQSLAFYVDVHFALLVCLAVYWQALAIRDGDPRPAYSALAAAVLLPSVKYSGLVTCFVLVPASGFCLWRAAAPRRPDAKRALILLAAAAFSAGWYVRNWLYRGNPTYPFGLPGWVRPLLALVGAPYEVDPEHQIASPTLRARRAGAAHARPRRAHCHRAPHGRQLGCGCRECWCARL
jgi:hypothetical protein